MIKMLKIEISLYSEKQISALEEFQRRYNLHSKESSGKLISLDDATKLLLSMAIDDNPADKYYPNYADKKE